MQIRVWGADYLIRLRGGVRCDLFVLREAEEKVEIVLMIVFMSDTSGFDFDRDVKQLRVGEMTRQR